MKKIISALTLGAMIAGAAFADVSINLNFRQRANLYTTIGGEGMTATKTALFTDAYSGNGSDNLAISLSGDIVAFDMQLVTDANTTTAWRSKKFAGTVFLGPVELFGGLWADGKLNGAYRTKTDVDAGNIEGMDFEFKKLGSAFKGSPSFFCDNLVQAVNTQGEVYALGGTYKLGLDNGAVNFNLAYLTNGKSDETAATSSGSLQGHTISFIADGRLDNVGQAELVFKYGQSVLKKKDGDANAPAMAFGLYAQPSITRALILTVGGAGSVVDGAFTDYSVDLRARYQVIPKKLSITSFHSYSALTDDGVDSSLKNETTKGIADGAAFTNGKCGGTTIKRDQVMSNNLMIRYNVNDKLSVFGIVADMIGMGDNKGAKVDDSEVQLRASAWTQFYADKNNSVAVGLVYSSYNFTEANNGKAVNMIAIPVIFRVKM
ncbi:MAG: hypothetical protein IJJ70_06325 [Treponema sp.]|nr:hypothetical protein [Treponema sp.]MBR0487299.1 hypothetical protein [Treponema sp.]